MEDEPKKSDGPKAQPITQPAPMSPNMQALADTFGRIGRNLKENYQNFKGMSPPMRFDAYGREKPIPEFRGAEGVPGGGGGAMVLPLQAVKGLRQSADPYALERVPSLVGNIFKNRKVLKEQWKNVGGPGPTDVKHFGEGKDMEALLVTPRGGGPEDVLKLAADPKWFIRNSKIDPQNLAAPFMVPTRMGVAPNVLWFQQPKLQATKDVVKKTPQQLGFDPRESARKMLEQESQSPWYYTDRVDFNVGFTPTGELKVLDVGSVFKRPQPIPGLPPRQPGQITNDVISDVLGTNYPHNIPPGAAPAQPIHMSSRPSPPTRIDPSSSNQMQLPSSWPQPTRPISQPTSSEWRRASERHRQNLRGNQP